METRSHPEVIGYMSGPVDATKVIKSWKAGEQLDYFGTSYLTEFCRIVRERGARAVVVTYDSTPSSRGQIDEFTLYNVERQVPHGLRYHLSVIRRMWQSVRILEREGIDTVVLTEGADYWFVTSALRIKGVRIIPAAHCRMWYEDRPLKATHRLLRWLNSRFFFRGLTTPGIVASAAIQRQFRAAGVRDDVAVLPFLPTYHLDAFAGVSPPDDAKRPFRILYAGRVMRNKGPLDLVPIARHLKARGLDFVIDVCGDGPDLPELQSLIHDAGLDDVILTHGFCARDTLLDRFGQSHAIIVPTRTDCEEGFAMICAEGVLAGRPVVTSRSCPAIEYLRPAVAEVEPEDTEGYANALQRLMTDQDYYKRKAIATRELQAQFFDPALGYGAALRRALDME